MPKGLDYRKNNFLELIRSKSHSRIAHQPFNTIIKNSMLFKNILTIPQKQAIKQFPRA
jgi:hypothetical protein